MIKTLEDAYEKSENKEGLKAKLEEVKALKFNQARDSGESIQTRRCRKC